MCFPHEFLKNHRFFHQFLGISHVFPLSGEATASELQALAEVLQVRLSDLMVCPLKDDEEVRCAALMGWLDGAIKWHFFLSSGGGGRRSELLLWSFPTIY